MTPHSLQLVLFAQRSRWERMGDRFHGGMRFSWGSLFFWGFVLAVFIAVLVWLSRYAKRKEGPRVCNSPRKLFAELSKAHALDRHDSQLLQQMATEYGILQPAALFLERDLFIKERLPKSLLAEAQQVSALGERLFRESGEEAEAI